MAREKCSMCGREKDLASSVVYEVTEAEKAALRKMGERNPPSKYVYCRPCHRLLSNPTLAVNLMKGCVEQKLRALGARDAESRAKKFGESLQGKILKK